MLINVFRPLGRPDRRAHYTVGEAAAITSFCFPCRSILCPRVPTVLHPSSVPIDEIEAHIQNKSNSIASSDDLMLSLITCY